MQPTVANLPEQTTWRRRLTRADSKSANVSRATHPRHAGGWSRSAGEGRRRVDGGVPELACFCGVGGPRRSRPGTKWRVDSREPGIYIPAQRAGIEILAAYPSSRGTLVQPNGLDLRDESASSQNHLCFKSSQFPNWEDLKQRYPRAFMAAFRRPGPVLPTRGDLESAAAYAADSRSDAT